MTSTQANSSEPAPRHPTPGTPGPGRPTSTRRTALPTDDQPALEQWEQLRRSVAMLGPGAWALRREQALEVLSALLVSLKR